jgi:transglutaminase-like putative cysteine protease
MKGIFRMQIRVGYEFIYDFPQPTPMILTVSIHYSRASDIVTPDHLVTTPSVPLTAYRDGFGNWCSRIVAPPGQIRIRSNGVVRDTGLPDVVVPSAQQHAVKDLPEETLVFLLGSRYCETDLLSPVAWQLFGEAQRGWPLVQAICDYAHNRITFDYQTARSTRTAWEAYNERSGVCRDYAHLAIALCRCMNIPARYCTGYLGDMGTPPPYGVPDFAAWFEVYLGGGWYIFDARNNVPRIGRVLIARGRDAADVAIVTTFGPNTLESFKVWTDEIEESKTASPFLNGAIRD